MERKGCSSTHIWRSHVLIDSNGVMLNATKDRISLEYELIIKMLPVGAPSDSVGLIIIHLPVLLLADYKYVNLFATQ